jgi:hypothetical protein
MQPELMGAKSIEITLSDNKEPTDLEIQTGLTKPMDTTGFREISQHELDSLVKVDPDYKLTDTLEVNSLQIISAEIIFGVSF